MSAPLIAAIKASLAIPAAEWVLTACMSASHEIMVPGPSPEPGEIQTFSLVVKTHTTYSLRSQPLDLILIVSAEDGDLSLNWRGIGFDVTDSALAATLSALAATTTSAREADLIAKLIGPA